ncbi:hypothetical protein M422DRAFT_29322 [Sphaerobolus stellatus SS14]|uniref:Uncharacterized protein n=1 Tax=Sphaerobolus stellatus (strain SS14) TaxID=990650 RepID=A0A0C9UHR1_SPHS4|nr:hypothetical protein M422DRAFT_38968 [Sphaerobolus stellatus SS14]KIJ46496.1 hypothetical protein M422DRAFT_29322 [Sphaerobolus stellatus SS14]
MQQPAGSSVAVNDCVAPFLVGEDAVGSSGTREDWRAEHFEDEEDMLEWEVQRVDIGAACERC